MKRTVSGVLLTLLLTSTLTLAFHIQPVEPRLALLTGSEESAIMQGTINLASQQPPPTEWNKTYGGTGSDGASALVQTSDGGYALAGETDSFGAGGDDFWLVKTDASGNTQWNTTYGGANDDRAYSVVQTTDGGYALAGQTYSIGSGDSDFWLVKTDATGNMQWSRPYGGTKLDSARSLIQTVDGGYALAGGTRSSGAGNMDFLLVKTDSSGNMQWSKTYGGAYNDYARSMIQTVDGGYAIAGYKDPSGSGYYDFWLVKTDASGNMQWSKAFGGTNDDIAYSVIQTNDGGYALTGDTWPENMSGRDSAWLVKTDGSGNMQLSMKYTMSGLVDLCAYSVTQTVDGGYALAGQAWDNMVGNIDFWLGKTDANGNMQWNKTCGGTGQEYAYSMIQTTDGGFAMAGPTLSFGAGGYDFWLVKIAPSNGGPPHDCGWPVLVVPVHISSNAGYSVGDTLTARFTIQNQGTLAIHLDKLLLGGRFNGGTLPGGGFPDFSYSSVTLQVGQTYQYEGTLDLTVVGYYQFFVAYYIANPTEAEKQLLDPNNWNTCIDLAEGLTDKDRTKDITVWNAFNPPYAVGDGYTFEEATGVWTRTYSYSSADETTGAGVIKAAATVFSFVGVADSWASITFTDTWTSTLSGQARIVGTFRISGDIGVTILYGDAVSQVALDAWLTIRDVTESRDVLTVTKPISQLTLYSMDNIHKHFPDSMFFLEGLLDQVEGHTYSWIFEMRIKAVMATISLVASGNAWGNIPEAKLVSVHLESPQLWVPPQEGPVEATDKILLVAMGSPVKPLMTDSYGRRVGFDTASNQSVNEIPGAWYMGSESGLQLIYVPEPLFESTKITLVGTSEGTYELTATFINQTEVVLCNAVDIPTSVNASHQYTVDWAALSSGEEGVTVQVDSNGDGVFEHTFTSDSVLTREEFLSQTGIGGGGGRMPYMD